MEVVTYKLYVHLYSASKIFNTLRILYSLLIIHALSREEIGHKAMIWASEIIMIAALLNIWLKSEI